MNPIASSSDACASIVNSLMHHRQGGESESFSRSAITSLVKKLKEKRDELDSLITAITTNGAQPTSCVTIPKTLDGRLQVASRKGFPHVIYAKIWRWPDLHKNELKQMDFCQYGFDHKDKDLVCVNPYHYNRVIGPGLDITGLTIGNLGQVQASWGAYQAGNGGSVWPSNGARAVGHNQHQHPQAYFHNGNKTNGDIRPTWYHKPGTLSYTANGKNNGNTVTAGTRVSSEQHHQWENGRALPPLIPTKTGENVPQGLVPASSVLPSVAPTAASAPGLRVAPNTVTPASRVVNVQNVGPISKQPKPDFWCSIAYFELDSQVGETFKVPSTSHSVIVDGYFSPMNSPETTNAKTDAGSVDGADKRFCLGALTNVHRTEASEKTRLYIGKGIRLDLEGEGDVWVKCQSGYAVFVQSYYLDREAGRSPGDAVHKIHPEAHTKVFDLRQCFDQMRMQCANANAATAAQAAAVAGNAHFQGAGVLTASASGVGVDDLRRLCILRMSFVKGWGQDYSKRRTIKETPCWIEIHLHRALQLCDEVLHSLPESKRKQIPD